MKLLERLGLWLAGDIGRKNKELVDALARTRAVIDGLNAALGQAFAAGQAERYEKFALLGAFALQNGGEVTLPQAIIDTVSTGEYRVEIGPGADGESLVIRLKNGESDQDVNEESEFTLPFQPAEAATCPPDEPGCGSGCPVCG